MTIGLPDRRVARRRVRRRTRRDAAVGGRAPLRSTTPRRLRALPPAGVAGWAMTAARRGGGLALGSAVAGVALASIAGLAAWTLTSSYDDLVASPARYGSTWDATVGNVSSEQQAAETRAALEAIPGIEAVGIRSTQGIAGDEDFVIMAAEPFVGRPAFGTILDGRAPIAPNEVALGRQSLEDLDASIGEPVTLVDPDDPEFAGHLRRRRRGDHQRRDDRRRRPRRTDHERDDGHDQPGHPEPAVRGVGRTGRRIEPRHSRRCATRSRRRTSSGARRARCSTSTSSRGSRHSSRRSSRRSRASHSSTRSCRRSAATARRSAC